jgi:CheY-like chemotaxis protein
MSKTVLIVDDSISIRALLKYSLDKATIFNIYDCADGIQALNIVNSLSVVDFIVCDIYMPSMDGFEFVQKLRKIERYQFTPVLFVSINNCEQNKLMAKKLGAIGLMKKPLDPVRLVSIVRETTTKYDHHTPSTVSLW